MLNMEQKDSGPLIISANSTVWNIILRCATCCRLRRKWGFPKITNLPKKKRCMEAAPFTYSGVNMFGPILIRERRSDLKHYAVLFT